MWVLGETMEKSKNKFKVDSRQLIYVILIILALYVFVPQISSFHKSWSIIRHVSASWTLAAVAFTLSTYFFAALNYTFLSLKKLRYAQVVLVQYAAMLVNRLLPAGVGALGANYAYLRNKKHNPTQAATVVAINNLFGILGHFTLILLVLFFSSSYSRSIALHSEHDETVGVWLVFVVILSLGVFGVLFARERLKRNIVTFKNQILLYRHHPLRLLGALTSSMALTLGNVICLYCSMQAVGIHLPFVVVLLIFTLGVSTGTVTPTPGGLGGFEAGLFAGFVAFHVGAAPALAIALLYRLISYWFAILLGAGAFLIAQRQHLFATR